MIFNEYYNNSILLCCRKNNEFKEQFERLVNSLPEQIISKCKKVRNFEKEVGESYYELQLVDEGIEFTVDYETLLNIAKITPKMMKEVYQSSQKEGEFRYEVWDVLSYSKIDEDEIKEIEYDFTLDNIDNKIYLKVEKMIDNEVVKEEKFELTKEEVESLVRKNIFKR